MLPIGLCIRNHFDMPWLKANPLEIVPPVAKIDVSEAHQFFKHARFCEIFGKIGCPKADLPHIEVADAVKGITRRCKGTGRQGKIPLVLMGFVQKEHELLDDTPDTGCQNDPVADIRLDPLIQCQWLSFVKVIAGTGHLNHLSFWYAIGKFF